MGRLGRAQIIADRVHDLCEPVGKTERQAMEERLIRSGDMAQDVAQIGGA